MQKMPEQLFHSNGFGEGGKDTKISKALNKADALQIEPILKQRENFTKIYLTFKLIHVHSAIN